GEAGRSLRRPLRGGAEQDDADSPPPRHIGLARQAEDERDRHGGRPAGGEASLPIGAVRRRTARAGGVSGGEGSDDARLARPLRQGAEAVAVPRTARAVTSAGRPREGRPHSSGRSCRTWPWRISIRPTSTRVLSDRSVSRGPHTYTRG